jgi:hypothetical protein
LAKSSLITAVVYVRGVAGFALLIAVRMGICGRQSPQDVELRGGQVVAQVHWDARGTLVWIAERRSASPISRLPSNWTPTPMPATVQRLVEMSERFCVIYQTLRAPPRLAVTHRTATGA